MNAKRLSSVVTAWAIGLTSAAMLPADVPTARPEQPGAPTELAPLVRVDGAAAVQPAEAEKPAIAPPRAVYDEAFDRVVYKAQNGWLEDPLKHLEGDMSHVVGELTAYKTDKPVQQVQDKVTSRLDALIKILEKECNGSAGGGANPSKPLGRSVLAKGPGGQGAMHDPKAGDKQWASLPPKQREQILQSRTEGFPPGFESLLQSYYQRLAQEQVGGDDAPAAPPAEGGEGETVPAAAATGERPAASAVTTGGGAK